MPGQAVASSFTASSSGEAPLGRSAPLTAPANAENAESWVSKPVAVENAS
jgi:hypothetical protein